MSVATDGYATTDDGLRLFVRTLGHGARTLVVPNGLYFVDALTYLADDRTLVVYDVRNRGLSETVTDRAKLARGIEQDADDLDAVRRHLGVDCIDLLGHSYIGLMVALYAMRYPSHVNRIVQIGPMQPDSRVQYSAPLSNTDATFNEVLSRIAELQKDRPSDPETACRRFWDVLRPLYVVDPRDADKVDWGRCELENERNLMRYWQGELIPSVQRLSLQAEDYAKATMPVLTIHGDKDRSAPYGGGRDWAARLPDARLLTIRDAGHAPWIEAPAGVFDAIRVFLDGRWPDGAEVAAK